MNKVKNIILDLGHGGVDSNGNYTTAPDKMLTFNDGYVIYEGEINRIQGRETEKSFRSFPDWDRNIYYTVRPDDPKDLALHKRTDFINSFDPNETICLSFHNNAGGGSGFEVYTYFGWSLADPLATEIYEGIKPLYNKYGLPMRSDKVSDGDVDKEIELWMTRETHCPTVLLEGLFFDNRSDAKLLKSKSFNEDYAFSVVSGAMNFIYKLEIDKSYD